MKRFTETDKWLDPWFQELPLDAKLVWLYLLDRCDNAGVWEPNKRLANFTIGRDIDWPEVERLLTVGQRIEILSDGKWHVCKFVVFQYGQLSKECAPHRQVLRLMERHGLHAEKAAETKEAVKPFRKACVSLKDKDKDKDKDSEPVLPFASEAFRAAWSDFVKHRGQLKKKFTPLAMEYALRELGEMGEARAIACIRHTISKGWQGLREPDGMEAAKYSLSAIPDRHQESAARQTLLDERRGLLALSQGTPEEQGVIQRRIAEIDGQLRG
jgi:hypothetical protein